jgi:protein tyrosine phosphatase
MENKITSYPKLKPPKLDTRKLSEIVTQTSPEFSPLSASSVDRATAMLDLALSLYDEQYLPVWYGFCIALKNPNEIRKIINKIFKTLKELEKERMNGPLDCNFTTKVGSSFKFKSVNRYADIIPYDYNRVVLHTKNHDYINASYLTSLNGDQRYIAAQGPVSQSFGDFWQMIWEQNTAVVVMLTREEERGRLKCDRYWPSEVGSAKRYHKVLEKNSICFKIFFAEEFSMMDGNTVIRELVVKREKLLRDDEVYTPEIRRVRLVQFLAWPDSQACDPRQLLQFIDICNEVNKQASEDVVILAKDESKPFIIGPMVIHCSAGVGRTGTFCCIDSVLKHLEGSRAVSGEAETKYRDEWDRLPSNDLVARTVNQFRHQRTESVQVDGQLQLCYHAVLMRLGDWFHSRKPANWLCLSSEPVLEPLESVKSESKRFSWSVVL